MPKSSQLFVLSLAICFLGAHGYILPPNQGGPFSNEIDYLRTVLLPSTLNVSNVNNTIVVSTRTNGVAYSPVDNGTLFFSLGTRAFSGIYSIRLNDSRLERVLGVDDPKLGSCQLSLWSVAGAPQIKSLEIVSERDLLFNNRIPNAHIFQVSRTPLYGTQFLSNNLDFASVLGGECNYTQGKLTPGPLSSTGGAIGPVSHTLYHHEASELFFDQYYAIARLKNNSAELYLGNNQEQGLSGVSASTVAVEVHRLQARTKYPGQMALSFDGQSLYFCEPHFGFVRSVNLTTGNVTRLVGRVMTEYTWPPRLCNASHPCTRDEVQLLRPRGLAVFNASTLFVGDATAAVVYRVDLRANRVEVIAGEMLRPGRIVDGFTGESEIASIHQLAVSGTHLFIADGFLKSVKVANVAAAPRAPLPALLCSIEKVCSGHATQVSGMPATECNCTCKVGWSGKDCSVREPWNVATKTHTVSPTHSVPLTHSRSLTIPTPEPTTTTAPTALPTSMPTSAPSASTASPPNGSTPTNVTTTIAPSTVAPSTEVPTTTEAPLAIPTTNLTTTNTPMTTTGTPPASTTPVPSTTSQPATTTTTPQPTPSTTLVPTTLGPASLVPCSKNLSSLMLSGTDSAMSFNVALPELQEVGYAATLVLPWGPLLKAPGSFGFPPLNSLGLTITAESVTPLATSNENLTAVASSIRLERINQTAFRLNVSALSPSFYAPADTETLTIRAAGRWLVDAIDPTECAAARNDSAVIARLRVLVPENSLGSGAAELVEVGGAVTVAAGSIVSMGAGVDIQSVVALGLMQCAQPGQKKAAGKAMRVLAPLATSNTNLGMLAGNLILVFVVFLLHALVTVVFGVVKDKSFLEAQVRTNFPNYSLRALFFVYQGSAIAAFNLLRPRDDGETLAYDIVFGVLGALASVSIPISIVIFAKRRISARFGLYDERSMASRIGSNALTKLLLPSGSWKPVATRKKYGALFSSLRRSERVWACASLWSPTLIVLGTIIKPGSTTGCVTQYAVLGAAEMLLAVVLVLMRPQRVLIVNFLWGGTVFSLGLVLAAGAMAMNDPHGSGKTLGSIATIMQVGFSVVRLAVSFFSSLFERRRMSGISLRTVIRWRTPKEDNDLLDVEDTTLDHDSGSEASGSSRAQEMEEVLVAAADRDVLVEEEDPPSVGAPMQRVRNQSLAMSFAAASRVTMDSPVTNGSVLSGLIRPPSLTVTPAADPPVATASPRTGPLASSASANSGTPILSAASITTPPMGYTAPSLAVASNPSSSTVGSPNMSFASPATPLQNASFRSGGGGSHDQTGSSLPAPLSSESTVDSRLAPTGTTTSTSGDSILPASSRSQERDEEPFAAFSPPLRRSRTKPDSYKDPVLAAKVEPLGPIDDEFASLL